MLTEETLKKYNIYEDNRLHMKTHKSYSYFGSWHCAEITQNLDENSEFYGKFYCTEGIKSRELSNEEELKEFVINELDNKLPQLLRETYSHYREMKRIINSLRQFKSDLKEDDYSEYDIFLSKIDDSFDNYFKVTKSKLVDELVDKKQLDDFKKYLTDSVNAMSEICGIPNDRLINQEYNEKDKD